MSIIAPIHPKIDTKRLTGGSATAIPYMVKLKCDCAAVQSLSVRCPRGVTQPCRRHRICLIMRGSTARRPAAGHAATKSALRRQKRRCKHVTFTTYVKFNTDEEVGLSITWHMNAARPVRSTTRTGTVKHYTWHKNHWTVTTIFMKRRANSERSSAKYGGTLHRTTFFFANAPFHIEF